MSILSYNGSSIIGAHALRARFFLCAQPEAQSSPDCGLP
jgi:hypothetical protein